MNKIYVWVYGIFIKDNKILLIKKARWPYTWMYDLPWGWIEFWEKIEESLKREIDEETGWVLKTSEFIWKNEYICDYKTPSWEDRTSHHIWFYYKVWVTYENLKTEPDWQDSLWAEFIDINDLDKIIISPIAKPMIEKVINL